MIDALLVLLLLLSLSSKVISLSCLLEFKFKSREISPIRSRAMEGRRLPRGFPVPKSPAGWASVQRGCLGKAAPDFREQRKKGGKG